MLTAGGGYSPNVAPDSDYEKAITACTMMLFGDALRQNKLGLDNTGHGAAYDAMEERCRVALGALMDH